MDNKDMIFHMLLERYREEINQATAISLRSLIVLFASLGTMGWAFYSLSCWTDFFIGVFAFLSAAYSVAALFPSPRLYSCLPRQKPLVASSYKNKQQFPYEVEESLDAYIENNLELNDNRRSNFAYACGCLGIAGLVPFYLSALPAVVITCKEFMK